MRKFLLKSQTTKEEQHTLLSCLHTYKHPHTQEHFIREVNDAIATFLAATMHAKTIFYSYLLSKVLPTMMIHKSIVWAYRGFVGWSQRLKAKIKEKMC